MNRIDRISAILIQLQSKKIVKAQEIANRFKISLRTVYRDIRTLEEAGVPIIGEAGVGYSLVDGYRLPPIMLTRDEATAFITAEKFIEKLTDNFIEDNYKSAMYKIKAVLRSAEKDYLENISENIEVVKNPYTAKRDNSQNHLQLILNCITSKNILHLTYFANHSQEDTVRKIEPVGIFFLTGNWHLIAFCQLRNDYRNFRIDRIKSIERTDGVFKKEHPSLKSFLKQVAKEEKLTTVIIQVEKEILKYLGDQKYYNGFFSQKSVGNKIEMTFLTSSLEGFARWYIMFGDKAIIINPVELKERVKALLKKIIKVV
jgi:predicted DNA-binding transcriptional regulator YafY